MSTEVLKTITDPPKNFQVFKKEKKDLPRTLLGFRDLPRTLLQEHLFLRVFLVWTYKTISEVPENPSRNPRGFSEDFWGLPKTILYVRKQKTLKNKCPYSNVLGKSLNPSNVLTKVLFLFYTLFTKIVCKLHTVAGKPKNPVCIQVLKVLGFWN